MAEDFLRVSRENGLWDAVMQDWERQCQAFNEDLAEYATASLPVLQSLATETQRRNAGVYAVRVDNCYTGLCQLNVAMLPGYDAPVLRVRHIVHSPRYDFDQAISEEEYSKVLGDILAGVYLLSEDEMQAKHIKFHFRSPAERIFFEQLKHVLAEQGPFSVIELRGSWLYISK